MQIQMVIMAGPTSATISPYSLPLHAFLMIAAGALASLIGQVEFKVVAFLASIAVFARIVWAMDTLLRDISGQNTCMWSGDHPYRLVCIAVLSTWSVFPVVWLMSPEGLLPIDTPFVIYPINLLECLSSCSKLVFFLSMWVARCRLCGDDGVEACTSSPNSPSGQHHPASKKTARTKTQGGRVDPTPGSAVPHSMPTTGDNSSLCFDGIVSSG